MRLLLIRRGACVLAGLQLLILVTAPFPAQPQSDDTQPSAVDPVAMERASDALLARNPHDVKARFDRATARSWQGKHREAQDDYNRILASTPRHVGALTGLGYDLAWEGRHAEARGFFADALKLDPGNAGAAKGLGYTYLWSRQYAEAIDAFDRASRQWPEDAEPHVAIGQAQLAKGRPSIALSYFRRALDIEPGRQDALDGLRAVYDYPPQLEFNVWAGNTSSGGGSGLRLLEAATWLSRDLRLGLRVDDTLGLDSPALTRSGEDARTISAGVLKKVSPRWLAVAELGTRDLPQGADQQIYKLEGVFLDHGQALKLGGQLSPHSQDYTDLLAYTGLSLPATPRWRIEPTFYYSRTGADKDIEWRGVVVAQHHTRRRWQLDLGLGAGTVDSRDAANDGNVFTAHATLRIPVARHHAVGLQVQHEDNPVSDLTIVMVGVHLRLPH